jgi:ferric-dicitrate binding protein FerR (iron transport regulator)
MHEIDGDKNTAADPLAEIVRAAGRRAAPPQEHYDQVYAAVHATWQRKVTSRRQRNWYALAAAVAFAAAGAALWQILPSSSARVAGDIALAYGRVEQFSEDLDAWIPAEAGEGSLHNGVRIRTGADGATAVRLRDGGSLRLSSNTELTLSTAAFELEYGTLYFDSAGRRSEMTIDVITALATVRDIGTQFEVRAATDAVRVRVRSGRVALLNSTASDPIAGASGEEIELSAAGELSRREFARDDPEWEWAQSLAIVPEFDSPTVLRYLTWIAEETGKTLKFESETVRLQAELARLLGDPRDMLPTELLATIEATSLFNYEMTEDGSILIRRKPDSR